MVSSIWVRISDISVSIGAPDSYYIADLEPGTNVRIYDDRTAKSTIGAQVRSEDGTYLELSKPAEAEPEK